MAAEEAKSVEALLAASYRTRTGRPCWGEAIVDERLTAYIAALRKEIEAGRPPVWARVQELMADDFGLAHSPETIRKHVEGTCKCAR